ncbi:MAG: thioredoxin [Bacteroidaceae bacterium]|nr:thioredoxin [Bacteroidaceae bacterium]
MKRFLYLIFVLAFSLFFINDVNAQRNIVGAEPKTIKLDKEGFLKRVVDFENSPTQWKYLGDKPAIIDFYADWCGPCRRLSPILEELAEEYRDNIYIYKVNVDDNKEIAEVFGITSLPTIVFVPMTGNPSAGTGFLPKDILKRAVNEILLKTTEH